MTMTLGQIEVEALKLPEADRVRLIDALFASLDSDGAGDETWRAEIMRRAEGMCTEPEPGFPTDQVFAELRYELAAVHAPRP